MNSDIELDNPEFQDVWKLISYTRQSVFMTGKAGTGKSTFLRYIVENTKKKTVVLAPTGIAAVNAGGVTLHSFFHIPLKPLLPDDPELSVKNLRSRLKHTREQYLLIRELELIIIDEVSMVRADILDFIDKVLRVYSGRLRDPFGGKQLLLVGDVFQLEPVVTANHRDIFRDIYPNLYFFSAAVFREFALVPIELKKVYRQTDSLFISMLDRMRLGMTTREDLALLNSRVLPAQYAGEHDKSDKNAEKDNTEKDNAETHNADEDKVTSPDSEDPMDGKDEYVMTLAPKRNTVDAINSNKLSAINRKLYTFEGIIRDKFPDNTLPAPRELQLKVGAQVVFVRNDVERRWVNGTIGKVHAVNEKTIEVELEGGARHTIRQEIWENVNYRYNEENKKIEEEVLGTFTQFPLRLAWALTIHKSQGLTFPRVIIDLEGGVFSAGQAYVAISRCQSLEGLTLRAPVKSYDFFVNPAIRSFSGMFNNPRLLQIAMSQAHADDCFHRAAKSFNSGNFTEAVDKFTEGLYTRDELANPLVNRLMKLKLYKLGNARKEVEDLRAQLREAQDKFLELAREYVAMGMDCLSDENYGAAIANFDKALRISPQLDEALRLKGEAAMDGGDLSTAAQCFGSLLERNPNDFEALFAIGKLHCILADETADESQQADARYKALNYLMAAEEVNEESAPLHDRMASLHEAMGDEEEAARHRSIARHLRKRR